MAFNLGETRLRTFKLMRQAVEIQDWHRAAMQLRSSLYSQQVTQRAERYAQRLEAVARRARLSDAQQDKGSNDAD